MRASAASARAEGTRPRYADEYGDNLLTAWEGLSDDLRGDTVIVVSVTDGDDEFIYFGR